MVTAVHASTARLPRATRRVLRVAAAGSRPLSRFRYRLGRAALATQRLSAAWSYVNALGVHLRGFCVGGRFEYGVDRDAGRVRYFGFWPYGEIRDRFVECEPVWTEPNGAITVVTSTDGDSYYTPAHHLR